jgi:hypothetical protein
LTEFTSVIAITVVFLTHLSDESLVAMHVYALANAISGIPTVALLSISLL